MAPILLETAGVVRLNQPTIHRLPSGLTLIAEQMPVEAVTLDIWAKVGSASEPDEINGMAHFLEHMLFKGTRNLKGGEFERRVEERGAVMNAATSQDYTHYYITCAPKDFAELAPLQLDIALNPALPGPEFAQERHVVLEEIRRAEDDPRRRTYARTIEATFDRLPYRRPVLGPTSVIEQMRVEEMREFYQSWYSPQNITAVAVGNLPAEEMIAILMEHLPTDFLERPNQKQRPILPPEPVFTERKAVHHVDSTLQQARLMMTWRVPGLRYLEDTYALDVLASILSHGRTSRLIRDLREERSLVTSISASNASYWGQGTFSVSARLPVENLEKVEAAIAEHLRALHSSPVTAAEISRVRTQVANRFVFANERPADRAGLYGYYNSLMGDLNAAFDYPTKIQRLSPEDLQIAAERYLSPEAYCVVTITPE